jgi:hypothetical protein
MKAKIMALASILLSVCAIMSFSQSAVAYECPDCYGSGVCTDCLGTGGLFTDCYSCNGSGYCSTCGGDGDVSIFDSGMFFIILLIVIVVVVIVVIAAAASSSKNHQPQIVQVYQQPPPPPMPSQQYPCAYCGKPLTQQNGRWFCYSCNKYN